MGRKKGKGGGGIRLNRALPASKTDMTDGGVASLAESVELIDPLLCFPLASIPRVPHETGHGDESAELGGDDADGRGVRAQVLFH